MSPITLTSKTGRDATVDSGNSPSTFSTRSLAPIRAKQPPTAISALDPKKAVPCCRPSMIEVSIMRSSRRAMVRIQAARCRFIAWDSEMRLNSLPSVDSEWSVQAARKNASAERSANERSMSTIRFQHPSWDTIYAMSLADHPKSAHVQPNAAKRPKQPQASDFSGV